MKLIAYNKFTIYSSLSATQLTSILESMTTTKKGIAKIMATTPFVGTISTKGFKLESSTRSTKGYYKRNSFSSVNIGKYIETKDGVDIVVTQRLRIDVLIFLMIWTSFLLSVLSIGILAGELVFIVFPVIMISGMAMLVIFSFNYEAKKKQALLIDALQK